VDGEVKRIGRGGWARLREKRRSGPRPHVERRGRETTVGLETVQGQRVDFEFVFVCKLLMK
jgi:hypothetical protein